MTGVTYCPIEIGGARVTLCVEWDCDGHVDNAEWQAYIELDVGSAPFYDRLTDKEIDEIQREVDYDVLECQR
jgi:hypothetical protein